VGVTTSASKPRALFDAHTIKEGPHPSTGEVNAGGEGINRAKKVSAKQETRQKEYTKANKDKPGDKQLC